MKLLIMLILIALPQLLYALEYKVMKIPANTQLYFTPLEPKGPHEGGQGEVAEILTTDALAIVKRSNILGLNPKTNTMSWWAEVILKDDISVDRSIIQSKYILVNTK